MCQCSKASRAQNRRRHAVPEDESVGDLVTIDHASASLLIKGLGGERELLTFYDLAIGYMGSYPVASKSLEKVLGSLVIVLGHKMAKPCYSDLAPAFVSAVLSLPGPAACTGLAFRESRRPTR